MLALRFSAQPKFHSQFDITKILIVFGSCPKQLEPMFGDNNMGGVVISPNIEKKRTFIDANGNEVVPYTKKVVKKAEEDYVPAAVETKTEEPKQEDHVSAPAPLKTISIQQQIEQAEKHLADLKVQKKAEIQRLKDDLAKLEATE